jgi:hypothetical protein
VAYRGASKSRLMIVDIGGQKVGIYYRSPTPSEYISYHQDKLRLKGGKVEPNLAEANINYGLKIITGVKKGDLEYRENGAWKPLETDIMPEEEWRQILRRDFFDLVDFVGAKVFNPVGEAESAGEGEEKKL